MSSNHASGVVVLPQKTIRLSRLQALTSNVEACCALADCIRSTLGPSGADKLIVDDEGEILVTNDGATILKFLNVQHPAASILVELSRGQDESAGDGAQIALDVLQRMTVALDCADTATWRARLIQVAQTCLNSKILSRYSDKFAPLAVDAVLRTGCRSALDLAELVFCMTVPGRSLAESELVDGLLLPLSLSSSPSSSSGAVAVAESLAAQPGPVPVAVLRAALDRGRALVTGVAVQADTGTEGEAVSEAERAALRARCEQVRAAGARVAVVQGVVHTVAQQHLAALGVCCVPNVGPDRLRAVARATDAAVVGDWERLRADALGRAAAVAVRRESGTILLQLGGASSGQDAHSAAARCSTTLVRAATPAVAAEAERALHDAHSVVAEAVRGGRLVPGGGAVQLAAAGAVRRAALTCGGSERMALDAFAEALEIIPRTVLHNAGLDAPRLVAEALRQHAAAAPGPCAVGVDALSGRVGDMVAARVLEVAAVAAAVLRSATEAAAKLVEVDELVLHEPRKSPEELGIV